jgi:hypothetical protein
VTDRLDKIAEKLVRSVAELPDRTSPDDWPEAMLVTQDELLEIARAALQQARDLGREEERKALTEIVSKKVKTAKEGIEAIVQGRAAVAIIVLSGVADDLDELLAALDAREGSKP